MRSVITVLIFLPLAIVGLPQAPGADNAGAIPGPPLGPIEGRTVNTIDPVTGLPVVTTVETLTLPLSGSGQGMNGATSTTGGVVVIGFSSLASRKQVLMASPAQQDLYAQAAKRNQMVRDGRIGDSGGLARNDRTAEDPALRPAGGGSATPGATSATSAAGSRPAGGGSATPGATSATSAAGSGAMGGPAGGGSATPGATSATSGSRPPGAAGGGSATSGGTSGNPSPSPTPYPR